MQAGGRERRDAVSTFYGYPDRVRLGLHRAQARLPVLLVGVGGGGMRRAAGNDGALQAFLEAIEIEIDDRGGEEGKQLAENQAANDGDAERAAEFGADAGTHGKR